MVGPRLGGGVYGRNRQRGPRQGVVAYHGCRSGWSSLHPHFPLRSKRGSLLHTPLRGYIRGICGLRPHGHKKCPRGSSRMVGGGGSYL